MFAWRPKLYEALDVVDNTSGDDALLTPDLDELESLSVLVRHHVPPELVDELGDLVELPGGEVLYHRFLVLSVTPPSEDHGTFEQHGYKKPAGRDVRFMSTLRDYASKGDSERLWYYADGELRSKGPDEVEVVEISDVTAYVDALSAALLED